MGPASPSTSTKPPASTEARLLNFARLVRLRDPRARVYLFGSRARNTAESDSDYDVVIVGPSFEGERKIERPVPFYDLWREAGGRGFSLDVHCYTPDEYRREIRGLGFLGYARRWGELHEVRPTGHGKRMAAVGPEAKDGASR